MAEVTAISNNVPVTVEEKVQPKIDTNDDLTNEDESVFTMEEALSIAENQKPEEVEKENKYSFADDAIDEVKDFTKMIAFGLVEAPIEITAFATKLTFAAAEDITLRVASGVRKVADFVGNTCDSIFGSEKAPVPAPINE
ncbi:MAG: hypothetical protein K6A44_02745 [bacterium]|nr:hypothetical protein [bacterium]